MRKAVPENDAHDADLQGKRSGSSAGRRPFGSRDIEPVGVLAPVDPISPGTLIGDYRVDLKLDEGGMGTVYRAVHPVIGKKVAIKLLHPHVARQEVSVARFIQEARAVNAIGHPSIVDIFGFGRFSDGRHYIVMEFLEGQHLLAFMSENGPLQALEASPLVRMIAAALAAAHAKGVIHRDLKPENVFLLHHADRRWPPKMKLLDFGLAKLVEHKFKQGPQTRMGATVGTPYYMAPEQCRGRTVDARTDVYALGVMFYEMLTGRVPFYAEQPVDVLYMHLTKEPDPVSLWTEVPEPYEKLISECMQKAPELRPSSMNAVIARLESIERGVKESASPSFADLLAGTADLLGASTSEVQKKAARVSEDTSFDDADRRGAEVLSQKSPVKAPSPVRAPSPVKAPSPVRAPSAVEIAASAAADRVTTLADDPAATPSPTAKQDGETVSAVGTESAEGFDATAESRTDTVEESAAAATRERTARVDTESRVQNEKVKTYFLLGLIVGFLGGFLSAWIALS
jgi:serine/threonine-protein kinase